MNLPEEAILDPLLRGFLAELEAAGVEHDAAEPRRDHRMLNITRDTGEFLAVMLHALTPAHILEIGTSNGYSTIWLSAAARLFGGRVSTIEASPAKVALAAANFARAGLSEVIKQIHGDALKALEAIPSNSIGLLFLDAERGQYPALWPELQRVLAAKGLLVVDNALSHVAELAPFVALVEADTAFSTSLVPVGKGEFLAVRR